MTTSARSTFQLFRVRAPRLQRGRQDTPLFATDQLWAHVKVYAEGGENEPHQHPLEDHTFIVLDGEATFIDKENNPVVLKKWEGIILPRGTVYRFQSSGSCDLVMLRVGAGSNLRAAGHGNERLDASGKITHYSPEQESRVRLPFPGRFFGDAT